MKHGVSYDIMCIVLYFHIEILACASASTAVSKCQNVVQYYDLMNF